MANTLSLVDQNKRINIIPGKIFINRSYKYLSPCMKLYGEEFITKMRLLCGLAIAIQDFGYNTTPESRIFENNIYYVIDTNGEYTFGKHINVEKSKIDFFMVISWLRQQDFYVRDYPLDSGKSGSQHIIVLKLPLDLIGKFINGDYANLYDKHTLDLIVPKTVKVIRTEELNPVYAVLSKDDSYLPTYLKQLNDEYNTRLTVDDIKHHTQFDIPPLPKNEIIRW